MAGILNGALKPKQYLLRYINGYVKFAFVGYIDIYTVRDCILHFNYINLCDDKTGCFRATNLRQLFFKQRVIMFYFLAARVLLHQ